MWAKIFTGIGAKGAWLDQRVKYFFPQLDKEIKAKRIGCFHLFDAEVKTECPEILKHVGKEFKFLPSAYSTPAAIDIFGDHVNILSDIHIGHMGEDFSFTVIVNPQIADAFRTWFRFMYEFCPKK